MRGLIQEFYLEPFLLNNWVYCGFTVRPHRGWGPALKTSGGSKEPVAWTFMHTS